MNHTTLMQRFLTLRVKLLLLFLLGSVAALLIYNALKPEVVIPPVPEIESQLGTVLETMRVAYVGTPITTPANLPVLQVIRPSLDNFAQNLAQQAGFTQHPDVPSLWQNQTQTESLNAQPPTNTVVYSLFDPSFKPTIGTINEQAAIDHATTFLSRFIKASPETIQLDLVEYLSNDLEPQITTTHQAAFVRIRYSQQANGHPIFYQDQSSLDLSVILRSDYQMVRASFSPLVATQPIGTAQSLLEVDQVIEEISSGKASIVSLASNSFLTELPLESITTIELTQGRLEYRITSNSLAYPFYYFTGKATVGQTTVDIAVIAPAVKSTMPH